VKARVHFTATTAPRTPVTIGVRKRPDSQGRAVFLRVDSVHQGNHGGVKKVYYINVVDCLTQFQAVCVVPRISEAFCHLGLLFGQWQRVHQWPGG
jgi:hypothetical protein